MPKPRKKSNKPVKLKLHIFCEGAKTEPNYFNGYLRKYHSSHRLLKVVKVEETNKNTPLQLVEEAIKLKNDKSTPDKDIFWVVYDREARAKYSDQRHREALNKANAAGICVSLTNVCFELWLLLHFIDSNVAYTCCDDLIKNSPLRDKLKKLGINKYKKADDNIFELISEQIDDARARAEKMNKATLSSSYHKEQDPHLLNPYTGVYLLLDAIDEFVQMNN